MKFFSRELCERRQSEDDTVLQASEDEWESALQRYEEHLRRVLPHVPAHVREFQDLLLHDAGVQSMVRQGKRFIFILRKDVPPRDLVILSYDLESEPILEPFSRHPRDWAGPTDFNFDEFDVSDVAGQFVYTQEIVFGNGWLLRLRFRDVQVARGAPVFPVEHGAAIPNLGPVVTQPA